MEASLEWWASKSSGRDSGPLFNGYLGWNYWLIPATFNGILNIPPSNSAVRVVMNCPVCLGLKLTQKLCFSSGPTITLFGLTPKYGTTGQYI